MSEFVLAKVELDETAATIAANREYIAAAVGAIKSARTEIVRKIRKDDFFLTTLEPYEPLADDAPVIRQMCHASALAGVGPMATVAGIIAQSALDAMVAQGCPHCWVDNGGDVALRISEQVTVEVFNEPGANNAFAFELQPSENPVGICTSSGMLGHSISFGNADVAVAVAESAQLADAVATALGNRVKDAASLRSCFDPFIGIKGFIGGLAMFQGATAMHGSLPRLVEVEHSAERVTAHSRMASPRFLGSYDNTSGVST
jgi:hypothetical protein